MVQRYINPACEEDISQKPEVENPNSSLFLIN
jgi:hypothetical protein